MLKRHTKLRKHVKKLGDLETDALLLSPVAERKVDLLISKLAELDEITKKLQRFDATVRIV